MLSNKLHISLLLVYILSIHLTNGQVIVNAPYGGKPKKLDKKIKEGKFDSGFIQFDNAVEIQCDLHFDWSSGIVYEKRGESILPHTAIDVVSFELIDKENENITRRFYSLPYEDEGIGLKKTLVFFEVLFEKNNLAILKFHYEGYGGIRKNNNTFNPSRQAVEYSKVIEVFDKIFLVRGNSGLKCLMEHEGNLIGFWQEEVIFHKVKPEVLEEIFVDDYNVLMEYFKKNDLKVKKVNDLIYAVKHYQD